MEGPARATLVEQLGDNREAHTLLAEVAAAMRDPAAAAALLSTLAPHAAALVLHHVQVRRAFKPRKRVPRAHTATHKLRIVTLGFGTARQRMVLE
jgi:hypothetical protein